MSAEEEPTPPAPLPKGKGEETEEYARRGGEKGHPIAVASEKSEEASRAVTPFPLGRGAGGVGLRRLLAVALLAAVGGAVWFFAIRTPEPRDDFGRVQGDWRLAVPADTPDAGQTAARRTPVVVRVTGDRWAFLLGDTVQKKYAMTLRPEADPKEIDLTQLAPDDTPLVQKWPPPERPVVLRGIYAVERGRARVVTAPGGDARPTSLDATDGVTVWLLERAP